MMKQANVTAAAPGFLGVNTEQAPTQLGPEWAAIGDNAVIDSSGRIASRKGYRVLTATNTALGSDKVNVIHEANYTDGTTLRFAVGNDKIFTFDTAGVLTDVTPGGATITGDLWSIATLNDDTLFFQDGCDPLVYDKSTSTMQLMTAHTDYAATVPAGDLVMAGYGHAWVAGVSTAPSTFYWSDNLIPAKWSTGTAGSLDCTRLWPTGNDTIQAMVGHNNKLIIFGRNSILVFGSKAADGRLADPTNDLILEDAIPNIGCVGKFAVTAAGPEILFIDDTGVRELGRVIQEKSLPVGETSSAVRTLLKTEVRLETNEPRLFYDPDEAFVLLLLEGLPHIYCFDMRSRLEDGGRRVTLWTGLDFACVGRSTDGTIWFGNNDGINKYSDYKDALASDGSGGTNFRMRYYWHPQTFGAPVNLKFPKEADFIIGGGLGQKATCYWGFDYQYRFKSQVFTLNSQTPDYYNLDEFNITTSDDPDDPTEYGSGGTIGRYSVPLSGSGCAVILGFEVDVAGQKVSIQEINLQTTIGRMV